MSQDDSNLDVGALTHDDIVALINAAHLAENQDDKLHLLAQVFEFAFNSQRQFLSEFFPHLLEFQLDRSVAIRKFIVGCIESVCKTIPEYIPQSIDHICRFISDDNANVAKRAILCATNLWRAGLEYLSTPGAPGPKATPQQQSTWVGMSDLKSRIIKCITDSDNDSLKPHALKFIETLVLTFSHNSVGEKKNKMDTFSLDSISAGHPLLSPGILEREGDSYVTLLIELLRKPGQTVTTLSTVVNTLTAIARHRHHFLQRIAPALIQAQQQPSPSFSSFVSSQQQNVNHSLRLALFSLLRLRLPSLAPFLNSLVESLTHLGAKEATDEATKIYGDLSKFPQPQRLPPSSSSNDTFTPSTPSNINNNNNNDNINNNNNNNNINNNNINVNNNNMNNINNNNNINKRAEPPDSPPPVDPRKRPKTEPSSLPPDTKPPLSTPPNPSGPPTPPPSSSPLSDADMRSILSLLSGLPTDLVVKLFLDNMMLVPPPPIGTVLPASIGDLLRSFQPAPALPPAAAPPTSTLPPAPIDPRLRDPRRARGPPTAPAPVESKNPSASPNSPPPPQNVTASQSQPTPSHPPPTQAQPGLPNLPETKPSLPPQAFPPGPPNPSLPPASSIPPPTQPAQPLPVVKPQLPKAPVLPLPTFTDAQLRTLSDATFARLLSSEAGATTGGKRNLWVALVARLATTLPLDGEMAQKLVAYVIADFAARRELVHTWVYHEFVSSPNTRYPQLIDALLGALRTLDPSTRAFNTLIAEMPQLPEEVWTMMCEYSTSRERVTQGLSTLRDLVVWRPPLRERGLGLLLEYTHHEDELIRSPAIRLVANQLYPLPALTQAIVEHAIAMLRTLSPARTEQDAEMRDPDQDVKTEGNDEEKPGESKANGESEDKKMEDGEKPIRETQEMFSEGQIQRKLFLYFALCTKQHDLLAGLLDVYMTATPEVRKVIHQQMVVPINTITMNSAPLLQLIAHCPKGGESFVLQVLRILTEASRPLPGLVNAVKTCYKRLGDARLLIHVLGGMEKDEVIELLPRLLVLPPPTVKSVITRLAIGNSPLACTELLVALHLVENVPIKRMLEATQNCLELESVFKQDVMAVVLSQLSSQPTVPQLFMFTALQTLQRLPKLTGYIIELMINLIPKQVWADKRLWEGFIRCCKVAKPTSYKVILKLPAAPFEEFLKGAPEFKEPLAKAAKADKKSIPKSILKLLGFDEPTASVATEEQQA